MIDRLRTRVQTRLDAGRQESGFTLIELLIVIVILGILAGIVVFAVGGITDRGDRASCKSDFASVEVGQEAHYAKLGAYAANVAALTVSPNQFLRSAPTNTKYAIATSNTGAVTATKLPGGTAGGNAVCDTV